MAEINIQKKKKPIWPWILGIIVLAALLITAIYWFAEKPDNELEFDDQTEQLEQPNNNLQDER